jgi:hypothetical protein
MITASAAPFSVFRMEVTSAADWTGWVTRKNTNNAAPVRIRTFLAFTGGYSVSIGEGLRTLLLKTLLQPFYRTEPSNGSLVPLLGQSRGMPGQYGYAVCS